MTLDSLEHNISQLHEAEERVRELRGKLSQERKALLGSLHSTLGYPSREDLVQALRALEGPQRRGRKPRAASVSGSPAPGKRARVTAEMRDGIVKALKEGHPGQAVAKRFGVSLPTVYNVKKAAGLVTSRKTGRKAKSGKSAA